MSTAKQKITRISMAFAVVITLLIGVSFFPSGAVNVKAEEQIIFETDVSEPSEGCVFLGLEGDYLDGAQAALDRLNEIRYEACTAGNVPDPRNSARMLTAADYVPIKWSTDLERIARIRAAESAVISGHNRLNGKDIWSVTSNGLEFREEVLAKNLKHTVVSGVNSWYEEKDDWVSRNSGAVTGHYTAMINPANTYVGIAAFYTFDTKQYKNNVAGNFSGTSAALDQTMLPPAEDVFQKLEVKSSYIDQINIGPIYKGETASPKVTFPVLNATLTAADTPAFVSGDSSVIEVSGNGALTGKKLGSAELTLSMRNGYSKTVTVEVTCHHEYSLSEIDGNQQITGTCKHCGATFTETVLSSYWPMWQNTDIDSVNFTTSFPSLNPKNSQVIAWVIDGNSQPVSQEMVFESSDETVLKILNATPNKAEFNVRKTGPVTINIYPKYNPAKKKTLNVFVGDEGDLSIEDADIVLARDQYTESGQACTPAVTVTYQGYTLKKGTHYDLEYSDNTAAGTAKVTVTGKGFFKDSEEKTFTIKHALNKTDAAGATCTASGNSAYWQCTACGRYFGDAEAEQEIVKDSWVIPAKGHSLSETEANEAACTAAGNNAYYTCTTCGKYFSDAAGEAEIAEGSWVVPAKGHSLNKTAAKAATCIKEGNSEYYTCRVCGKYFSDAAGKTEITEGSWVIEKTPHTYGDWTVTKEAACTEAGSREKVCSFCNDKITEEIPATGHKWNDDYTVDQPATHSTEGVESIHCSVCNAIREGSEQSIPVTDHEYGEWIIIRPATCTEAGEKEHACIECGKKVTEVIPATDHSWDTNYTVDREPTCTETGIESIHCTACGIVREGTEKIMDVIPHAYGGWVVTEEATYDADGLRQRTCKECGAIDTEIIPKLEFINISAARLSGISNKIFTGNPITQNVVLTMDGKKLTAGTDYDMEYQNNINAGTAAVVIIGKGNYIGSVSRTFSIAQANNTITKAVAKKTVKAKTLKKKNQTFKIGAIANGGAKVTYKATVPQNAKKYIKVASSGKVTVKKGLKKGTYTIKVRITAAATQNYKAAKLAKTVRVIVK